MVSWRRLAPITATERGLKNVSIDFASARCSRVAITPANGVGRLDRELQRHHAVLDVADQAVAGVAEGLDHPLVVGQHLGDEPLDAALAAGLGEVLEQQLADAAALLGVLDEERHLGPAGAVALVAAERDDPLLERDHEGHPLHVVDLGEPLTSRSESLGIAVKNRKYFDWSDTRS